MQVFKADPSTVSSLRPSRPASQFCHVLLGKALTATPLPRLFCRLTASLTQPN